MSSVDPGKLKSLVKNSQTELPDTEDEEESEDTDEGDEGAGDDETEDEADGDDGDEEEVTVDSLAESFAPAVASINEIIDEFRGGGDAQPKAGVEQLEEDVDAETVHEFCAWTVDAGKKDFRKLGEALDLEDVDGFVGWCRAVRKMEEDGEGEGGGEDGKEEQDDEGAGDDEAMGEEETEDEGDED